MILVIQHRCGHGARYHWPNLDEQRRASALGITLLNIRLKLLRDAECPVCYPLALERELWSGYAGQDVDHGEPDIICGR